MSSDALQFVTIFSKYFKLHFCYKAVCGQQRCDFVRMEFFTCQWSEGVDRWCVSVCECVCVCVAKKVLQAFCGAEQR